jgi:hypothetical protein
VLELLHATTNPPPPGSAGATGVGAAGASRWTQVYMVPLLVLTLLLVPALVPLGIIAVLLRALWRTKRAVMVTHKEKSILRGLAYGPALVYM